MSLPRSSALERVLSSCVAFTLLGTLPALAQQTVAPPANSRGAAADSLDEISVSATGVPTPVTQTGSSVTVLTADTLEAQQRRTLPDALQQVPGLNVVQTGGPGGQTSVFIRGSNSNHVKTFIDGIDVSDPSNSNASFDYGQALTDDVDRIEVLRGPQSGLYGADAIGGVISMVTKRGEGPTKITARVEGGSFGTFNQSGRISGSQDGFDYSVTVSHFRAAETPVTPRELVPIGRRFPNYYDNETVSAKLGYQFTDDFRINSVTRFVNSKLLFSADDYGSFPTFVFSPGVLRGQADVQNIYTRNEAEWTPFVGFHNIVAINYSNMNSRNFSNIYNNPLATPAESENVGERLRYEYRGDYLISPGNVIVFGAQRDEERLNNTSTAGAFTNASNGNTGGYGEVQLTPFDRASIVANVRHDENDAFGGATTYRIAPSYIVPGTETRIKGSVGTGFKAPTLSQLFVSGPFVVGNPNLKPEESFGYDAGLEQPIGDRFVVGGTYYANDFKNLIVGVFDPAVFAFTSVNLRRAESYGAEAFASMRFSDTLSARVDYTNTVSKGEDGVGYRELLRRPRHKGTLTAFWNPMPHLTVSGTVLVLGSFVDGARDALFTRTKNPGFTTVNLAVNYDVNDSVSVFGRVDNLFDRRYENPTGFLGGGLAVYGGVRVSTF